MDCRQMLAWCGSRGGGAGLAAGVVLAWAGVVMAEEEAGVDGPAEPTLTVEATPGEAEADAPPTVNGEANGQADGEAVVETGSAFRLPGLTVIGTREAEFALPGAGSFLDVDDIRTQNYDDINRVLRKVPGVYVREEDGFGLMPNISLRGADMGRTSKVTLMEDGVLAAPAPYSAPAAYYSPTVGRMEGVEVLKGSSQVRYGPHTTGGVVNYLSTSIPSERRGYTRTSYGTDNDIRVFTHYGDTFDTDMGRFGLLLEGYFRSNDGFQRIDATPDFRDRGRTGFTKIEPMLKLSWEPDGDIYQQFEFKAGYTDLDADISYLGLTRADFRSDPHRRYAASRFDRIQTEQWRTHVRHYIEPSESFNLTSTVYYNEFDRNWSKLHDLQGAYTYDDGTVVNNPSLAAALAGGGTALDALRGNGAGTLRYRDNKRSYYSWGAESIGEFLFETGGLDHRLAVGVRYHEDRVRRFQHDTVYTQNADGVFVGRAAGAPGSQDNRRADTQAIAVFVQDEMSFGDWTVTPGIRYEHLRQSFENFNTGDSGSGNLDLVAGGVGVTYDFTDEWMAFGGAYVGFSPPEPQSRITQGVKEETSLGTELGLRYQHDSGAFRAQSTYFFTQFDDLLVRDYVGAGGGAGDESVGRIRTHGIELSLEYDAGIANGWGFRNPYYVAATWTRARLASDTGSANPESIFSGGQRGNRVPYVPEWAITLGTGIEFEKFGFFINGIYVDETYTTASNTRQQVNVDGEPDARFGTTDSHFLLDLSAHYWVTENAKLFAGVQNALDREYVASRHPHGARSGAAMFAYMGVEVNW
ncbi:TonB-dependent receptor family protein [Phycisphaerales bacterium AB-hyl4]|uniref:TonB-dependent receptor family protein n=1 Tax=Natronomicrosphaera hydrolytica TaxID=3242702 RepID=A0ABV4U957_9BACT